MGVRYTDKQKELIEAARTGDVVGIQRLIAEGYDVDCELKYGSSALMIAASRGYADVVEILCKQGAKLNRRNKFGSSALMEAVDKAHIECIKVLIQHGAEINMPHNNGNTALLAATFKRDIKSLRVLLELGADAKVENFDHWNPISWAQSESNDALLQVFKEFKLIDEKHEPEHEKPVEESDEVKAKKAPTGVVMSAYWAQFMRAASAGDIRTLRELAEGEGVEVNAQSPNGTTALIAAAKNGKKEAVFELIELGADLNIFDQEGMTALCWAAKRGDVIIVQEILDKAIKLQDGSAEEGLKEALAIATNEGHTKVAQVIKENLEHRV